MTFFKMPGSGALFPLQRTYIVQPQKSSCCGGKAVMHQAQPALSDKNTETQ
jgi:hypothetical protein